MGERWLPVVGYEGLYSVSDLGSIRSETRIFARKNGVRMTVTGRVLVQTPSKKGYPKVELWKNGRQDSKQVHTAVAETFLGPKPKGLQTCHDDGIPGNCLLSNLRYDTVKGNEADKVRHGTTNRGERCGNAKLSEKQVYEILKSCELQRVLAVRYGVSPSHISSLKARRYWAHLRGI